MGFVLRVPEAVIMLTAWYEAKKRGITLPDINAVVGKIKNMDFDFLNIGPLEPEKLYFAKPGDGINSSAVSKRSIIISRGWLYQLATHPDDENVKAAFRSLIGHEHAHNIAYWNTGIFTSAADKTVISYLNEVYADITGCRLAFGDDRETAVKAMEWLGEHRGALSKEDGCSHPSNASRIEYVRTGQFDASVINQVISQAEAYVNRKRPRGDYHFPDALRSKISEKYPDVGPLQRMNNDRPKTIHPVASLILDTDKKLTLREVRAIVDRPVNGNSKSFSRSRS